MNRLTVSELVVPVTASEANDLRAGGDELFNELLAGLLAGGIDDAAAPADLRHWDHLIAIGNRRSGPIGALVTRGPTVTTLPRLDHLGQLADRALQLGDLQVALEQRFLQLGDALRVGSLFRPGSSVGNVRLFHRWVSNDEVFFHATSGAN